ncbi:MAG TPA: polysaccharide biosynthesis/export family protein, partial [Phycisphaerae bacterium]|nr:polysaccharide biosynthesis/export family protein [Phycisphaerae bacterium]
MFVNSWFDPSQVGNFQRECTLEIRTSLSIQDTPIGVPGATDPTPEDLIPIYQEYRFEVGDALSIRVFELVARNTETAAQVVIDELGTITMPVLGEIHVVGMTRNEIRDEIRQMVVDRGILQDATVIIEPLVRRGQSYLIFGATAAPNLYPLSTPNTRLLEALNTSGGFFDTVTDIYVIREETVAPDTELGSGRRGVPSQPMYAAARPVSLSGGLMRGTGGRARAGEDPQPEAQRAAEDELRDAVLPPTSAPTPTPAPRTPTDDEKADAPAPVEPAENTDLSAGQAPTQPRWIYLNGEWIETSEVPATNEPAQPAPVRPAVPSAPPSRESDATMPDLDWTRLAGDTETRVIHVSAAALRDGDP